MCECTDKGVVHLQTDNFTLRIFWPKKNLEINLKTVPPTFQLRVGFETRLKRMGKHMRQANKMVL